ncbi:ROK family protein [Candidatus Berkelbacteria bacterium]|nr:ROK family protein [Candidatus Berkelbacteria bacterium]
MDITIGIDIGASKIAAGLVDGQGRILQEVERKTAQDPDGAVEEIRRMVERFLKRGAQAVGVGAPGRIDVMQGIIIESPNLPRWQHYPLKEKLEEKLNADIVLDNDANTALLGEVWQGAARGKRSALMLTLGTGVGGALWKDGKLWRGEGGTGAELGHIIIDPVYLDSCQQGHRGCLESMIGGAAHVKKYGKNLKELFADRAFVTQWAMALQKGVETLVAKFHPDIVILGGGVIRDHDKFLPQLQAVGLPVVAATLGPKSGIIGAAYLALGASKSEAQNP